MRRAKVSMYACMYVCLAATVIDRQRDFEHTNMLEPFVQSRKHSSFCTRCFSKHTRIHRLKKLDIQQRSLTTELILDGVTRFMYVCLKPCTGKEFLKTPHEQTGFERAAQAEGLKKSVTGRGVWNKPYRQTVMKNVTGKRNLKRHAQRVLGCLDRPQYRHPRISQKLS